MGRSTCDTAVRRAAFTASLLGALLPGAVHAKELKLPADHPLVAMDVPDDWSIDTTPVAIEMKAPEKNAIVVAKVIDAQKTTAEAFSKQAVAALQAFGVTFAKTGAKTPPAAAPAKTAADKTAADKTAAASTPQSKLAAAGLSSFNGKTDSFTFTGAPSLAIPGTSGSNNQEKTPPNSVESLTGFGATITGAQKLPLRAAQYFGTTLNGRPVDVQFVLFRLPDNKHFLAMMQESGGDDGRTVAMAQSVKAVK